MRASAGRNDPPGAPFPAPDRPEERWARLQWGARGALTGPPTAPDGATESNGGAWDESGTRGARGIRPGPGPGARHHRKHRGPGQSATRTVPGHGPVSRTVRRCTSVSRFPALSQVPARRTPRSDGLYMTHRRAGDATRVGEPDDRPISEAAMGTREPAAVVPAKEGPPHRAWESGGRAPRRRWPAGPGRLSRTRGPHSPAPIALTALTALVAETGGNDTRDRRKRHSIRCIRSSERPGTADRPPADRPLRGARDGAGCPNLPQRPRSRRNAGKETLIFRAFLRGRSRLGAPLWQIWTRPAQTSPRSPTRPTAPIPTSRSRRDKARCTRRRSASEDEKAQQTRVRDPGPIPPDRHDRHDRPTAMTDRAAGAGSGEGEHAGPPCQGRSARHRLNRRHRGP